MRKISRNALCSCGSGRKYKNCCGAKRPSALKGMRFGMRMKGGVRSNPTGDGFIAIVHTWDNIECRGEPDEWRAPEVFSTEEEAMQYYRTHIRPVLEQMIAKTADGKSGTKAIHRRLE